MTKRQIAFGVICFLGGILVGMEEESIMEQNACAVRRFASKVGHAAQMRANGQEG